jgi:NAD(P)-dependent dehydrogenase (short-subunit alcohol dehydrogenase family)
VDQLVGENGPAGVRTNAICPSRIATHLRETSPEILGANAPDVQRGAGMASPERLREIVPLGSRGTPEEVAHAAALLASAESDYLNGHALVVDGGWVAH